MRSFFDSRFVLVYLVPGAVFQSVMVGGGYGTGREIVEYFTSYGFMGGLLAMSVSFATLVVILALSFELARRYQVFDYRNFFKLILGRAWPAFEVLIVLQFLLVLAVLASAAGNILRDHVGLSYEAGLVLMLALVCALAFYGRDVIVRVLTYWSIFLYAVFLTFFAWAFAAAPSTGTSIVAIADIAEGWMASGFKYALYNLAAVPLLLYVARHFTSRKEALVSGFAAGVVALVPALLFHITFSVHEVALLEQSIPVYWLMTNMGASALLVVYSIMLFGTFVETGAGMLQGINERIDVYLIEKRGAGLSRMSHVGLAVIAIVASALLSLVGISALIARGYGTMAWGFLLVYVLPLVVIGTWRIFRRDE